MRTPTAQRGALEDRRIPVQVKLAAAWTSFMFLYLYVDYLALYKPGFIDELRAGIVHEFEIGPTFVGLALTLIAIPSLMVLLSATLPARANRIVNIVVAAIYIPVSIYNAAGESLSYGYFYGLSIGLEVLILALVIRWAWTWPRTSVASTSDLVDEPAEVAVGR